MHVALAVLGGGILFFAGWLFGGRSASKAISRVMDTDRAVGEQLLERLGKRWGAKVEIYDLGGGPEVPRG